MNAVKKVCNAVKMIWIAGNEGSIKGTGCSNAGNRHRYMFEGFVHVVEETSEYRKKCHIT